MGFPPGIIIILSGPTSALYKVLIFLLTDSLHSIIPLGRVYPWWPSFKALIAALTACAGDLKSDCPKLKSIISFPSFVNFFVFANILYTASVPSLFTLLAILIKLILLNLIFSEN